MKWLESRFTKFSLTPKDICDKLVVGLPVSANYKIAAINPARDYICVEITVSDDSGVVFLTARSIEFQERQLHLNMTEVRANLQGYGTERHWPEIVIALPEHLDWRGLA
jgi:hypothetical protein